MSAYRLDKLLSNLGYDSRKGATIIVKQGRVSVEGEVIKNPAHKVDPNNQEVFLDGERIEPAPPLTVILHKPEGVICDNDPGQPDIFEYLPHLWRFRNPGFKCAGRLDKDSRGLVILSEDGQIIHQLISPGVETPKTYIVKTQTPLTPEDLTLFESGGMMLKGEEKPLKPVICRQLEDTRIEMTLTEGRHRQIRRMMAARDNDVQDLMRTKIGPYELGDLEPGEIREIKISNIV